MDLLYVSVNHPRWSPNTIGSITTTSSNFVLIISIIPHLLILFQILLDQQDVINIDHMHFSLMVQLVQLVDLLKYILFDKQFLLNMQLLNFDASQLFQ